MIDERTIKKYSATLTEKGKGEIIFQEGDSAVFFYIVRSGKVKMMNISKDGKEFIQGYFTAGQSFGEPPFFLQGHYPASAVAVEKSSVWKIPREHFLQLLKDNFDIHLRLTSDLSARLIYKATMLSELAIEEAEHRLVTLIQYFVAQDAAKSGKDFILPLTRQQLADMTGLRVETVIRCIKLLEQKKILSINDDSKIVWKK
jgi:CRP-like cAMP-binding protein